MDNNIKEVEGLVSEQIKTIEYGTNYFSEYGPYSRELFDIYAECLNEIHGIGAIEILDSLAEDGEIQVIWRVRTELPTELSYDDIMIFYNAEKASKEECKISFSINPLLFKLARKKAKMNDVVFKQISKTEQYFDGSKKRLSVLKRIELARLNNEKSITFSFEEISIQTLRVYASQLGMYEKNKYRVTKEGTNHTIWFGGVDELEAIRNEFDKFLCKMNITMEKFNEAVFSTEEVLYEGFGEDPKLWNKKESPAAGYSEFKDMVNISESFDLTKDELTGGFIITNKEIKNDNEDDDF